MTLERTKKKNKPNNQSENKKLSSKKNKDFFVVPKPDDGFETSIL